MIDPMAFITKKYNKNNQAVRAAYLQVQVP